MTRCLNKIQVFSRSLVLNQDALSLCALEISIGVANWWILYPKFQIVVLQNYPLPAHKKSWETLLQTIKKHFGQNDFCIWTWLLVSRIHFVYFFALIRNGRRTKRHSAFSFKKDFEFAIGRNLIVLQNNIKFYGTDRA